MKQYEVRIKSSFSYLSEHPNIVKAELHELSRVIGENCEVFELGSGNPIILGHLSMRSNIYIGLEIIKNMVSSYPDENYSQINRTIFLVEKFLNDESDSSDDFKKLHSYLSFLTGDDEGCKSNNNKPKNWVRWSSEYYLTLMCEYLVGMIIKLKGDTVVGLGSVNLISNVSCYIVSAYNKRANKKKAQEKEFLRQGLFIIDFLKSGKHLFMV